MPSSGTPPAARSRSGQRVPAWRADRAVAVGLFVAVAATATAICLLPGCGAVAPVTAAAPRAQVEQVTADRNPYRLAGEMDPALAAELTQRLQDVAAHNSRSEAPGSAAIKAAGDLPGPACAPDPRNRRSAGQLPLDEVARAPGPGGGADEWAGAGEGAAPSETYPQ